MKSSHIWSTNVFSNEQWVSLSLIFLNQTRNFWNPTFSSSVISIFLGRVSLPTSIGAIFF